MNTTSSLSIDFSFQAHQLPRQDRLAEQGLVQLSLQIGRTTYGSYLTAFRTTQTAWLTRKAVRPTSAARQVDSQVTVLSKHLWDAWQTFPRKQTQITGEMILNRAGLKVVGVAEGGALYVL